MPTTHRATTRSSRRFWITAVVIGLFAALIGPAGAATGDGYQYEISSGGQYAFDQGRQDDADSSMRALVEVYLDGDWVISGLLSSADAGTYTVAVGTAGTCTGNTELFDISVLSEDADVPFNETVSPALPASYDFIRIYEKGTACQTVWADAIPTTPTGMITTPATDSINMGAVELGVDYYDNDYDSVQWAVRSNGACPSGNADKVVAGNVAGATTPFEWDGKTFSSSVALDAGYYCFVFNTATNDEDGLRLTRTFYVADAEVSGGGQIVADSGDRKDPFKVSFGGELFRVGEDDLLCEWTVQYHNTSTVDVDKATFVGDECSDLNTFPLRGADGVVNFRVDGTLDGVPGYHVRVRAEDAGEPGGSDTIRFELHGPSGLVYDTYANDFSRDSSNSGTARTYLDRGNLQITY